MKKLEFKINLLVGLFLFIVGILLTLQFVLTKNMDLFFHTFWLIPIIYFIQTVYLLLSLFRKLITKRIKIIALCLFSLLMTYLTSQYYFFVVFVAGYWFE